LDDDAKAFAILKSMSDSMDYIRKHLSVITEKKADQILGHAFTLELAGKHALSLQYVRQSLILTYILQMGASGVNVFFSRIGAKGPAQDMFEKDVESRYKHIVGRCKVIKSEDQESDEQQVESIQLQCDDPTAPIRMSVPDESDESEDPARVELFKQLPESLQSALSEGTLDAVNKVLADIPGPEAERLLAICGQGGFLVIDGEIVVDPSNEAESSTKE
ncbi:hsp90 co-chaperone Cdc37, partial [Coemansia thaxteri]